MPGKKELLDQDRVNISVSFSLIGGQVCVHFSVFVQEYWYVIICQTSVKTVILQVKGCHPGYRLDESSQTCVCDSNDILVQCDAANRYFYARVGF